MTDDDLDALFADAQALANRACTACGFVTSPYALVEVRVLHTPVRWLCWTCLHTLFGSDEEDPP